MSTPLAQRDSQSPQEKKNRTVRTVILVTGTLFVLAMAYGSGMRGQVKKLKAMNEERKVVQRDLRFAYGDLRLRLTLVRQLEARRLVHTALLELDKRNFGVAQEQLSKAATLLRESAAAATGNGDDREVIVPNIGDAADRLEAIKLVASEDFGEQRTQLLTVADQMDKAFADYLPNYLEKAAASDDAVKAKMKADGFYKPTMNDVPQLSGNDVTRTQ
jgi:hypothetical protein